MSDRLTPEREAEIAAAVAELDADRTLSFGTWTAGPVSEKSVFPPELAFVVEDVARIGGAAIRGSVGVFGSEQHADFAALARTAVGELLAELAAVRAERDEAREQAERLEDRNFCLLDQQAKDDAEFSQVLAERDRYRTAWQSARFRAQAYGEGILRHVADRDTWKRWLKEAEARIRELERPAIEAKRDAIRLSFDQLAAQCREDRDPEGAFDVQCRLRDREAQWKREDEEAGR